ncbi:MAG: rRNA maturation RNase YbeY [Mollicutes bacterium]|nr:rRNA maturation RNase YbeY [Mollicutes bacterium]
MNNFDIYDDYGYNDFKILNKVFNKTLEYEKVNNAYFSVVLVNENKIRTINRDYRDIDKVTDVISFAFEDNDKRLYNGIRVLGEIYICIPQMIKQAKKYGHSKTRELAFLGVHGLLHLLGYNHMNAEEEKIMFTKQEEILNGFNETKR